MRVAVDSLRVSGYGVLAILAVRWRRVGRTRVGLLCLCAARSNGCEIEVGEYLSERERRQLAGDLRWVTDNRV